jgi:orotate phosphoribosyltransferase
VGLFQLGDFTLASGAKSRWKIECDALAADDWAALAAMAAEVLPPFCRVVGVPRGGLPFAAALSAYATGNGDHPLLVAEDVVTTGRSAQRLTQELSKTPGALGRSGTIGVCVFARGECPDWITPLFQMPCPEPEQR